MLYIIKLNDLAPNALHKAIIYIYIKHLKNTVRNIPYYPRYIKCIHMHLKMNYCKANNVREICSRRATWFQNRLPAFRNLIQNP